MEAYAETVLESVKLPCGRYRVKYETTRQKDGGLSRLTARITDLNTSLAHMERDNFTHDSLRTLTNEKTRVMWEETRGTRWATVVRGQLGFATNFGKACP